MNTKFPEVETDRCTSDWHVIIYSCLYILM